MVYDVPEAFNPFLKTGIFQKPSPTFLPHGSARAGICLEPQYLMRQFVRVSGFMEVPCDAVHNGFGQPP